MVSTMRCGCQDDYSGYGLGETAPTTQAVPNWVRDLIKTGVDTTAGIARSRYGVPPAGTSVTQRPDGFYQVLRAPDQPGFGVSTFPGFAPSIDLESMLVYGLLGLVAFGAIRAFSR